MISRLQFEEAYKRFPPSAIEKFYFKYFSIHTIYAHPWVVWIIAAALLIPFIVGFIFRIMGLAELMIELPMFIHTGIITIFTIAWVIVYRIHKYRLRKVRKFLGMTRDQLKELSYKYYFSRFNSPEVADLANFIKSKCKDNAGKTC